MATFPSMMFRLPLAVLSVAALALAEDDPVVAKAKQGTRIAVRKTKEGTSATVRAVRSAAEWTSGDPTKISPDDIAKARKKGLVWADHQDWIYYKDGPNYGRTDTGEFWTEDGAKGAGYKLASAKAAETPKPIPHEAPPSPAVAAKPDVAQ